MKKSTPAPIFNHRKRPRQAVIADPQTIDGPGTGTPVNTPQSSHHYQDLMPVRGFDGQGYVSRQTRQGYSQSYQQNKSQQGQQQYQLPNRQQQQHKQQYSYDINKPSPIRESQIQNAGHQGESVMTGGNTALSFSNCDRTGKSEHGWQTDKYQSLAWSTGQASYTNRQGVNSYTSNQKTPQRPPTIRNNHTNWYGQQQSRSLDEKQSYNSQAGSEFVCRINNSGNNSSNTNIYKNQHPFQKGSNQNQNMFRPGPSGAATVQGADNTMQHLQRDGYHRVGGFGDTVIKPSSTTQKKDPQKPPKKTENKADKTLHLITSTIQGIKHWSKYRDTINMIFEVYGVVDSALMQDPSGTGKEFLMKDEQDSMQCVFYEIDRQLPRLTRGHWHRCVGTMDERSGKFKCVSVRPASMEEKDISKLSVKKSDNFLWDFTKTTPEP
ncbi:spermatogenesis-associated protein 22-like [Ylistrum balloti]|uniref:spermatogenesis-associated protein 22-like n=1 Tax=Ylistrum balloti TaxID=509963 RepID=UPI002905D2DB|nr:spermatogenesis-associated protein 22-like [Ylistrum balloti]